MNCNDAQQRLASGEELSRDEQVHLSDCPSCSAAAASYCMLEEALGRLDQPVPAGFADRVMVRIHDPAKLGWVEQRWVQVVFVYGGFGVAVFNLVRFVAGILVASVGLGGTP